MRSFKLETSDERKERAKTSEWNLQNFKFSNITPELAEKYIKEYWIAGLVTMLASVIFYAIQGQLSDYILDFILSGLFVLGVYKRVRWVAILYFIYFLIGKINLLISYAYLVNAGSIFLSIVFLKYFYLGMLGVIRWHQFKKEVNQASLETSLASSVATNLSHEGFKYCSKCGAQALLNANFCKNCGSKLN